MISAGLMLAQCNAELCQPSLGSWDVHWWLAQWWGRAVQSSQLRSCCQCLFVPVAAVTALALKDNYSNAAPPFPSPEASGLGLAFIVLLLGLVWRCPQIVNSYPRIEILMRNDFWVQIWGYLLPSHKKRQAGRWVALKRRSYFLNLFLVPCLGFSSGTWCLLQLLTASLQCWGRRSLTKAMLFVLGALIAVSDSTSLQQQWHSCHRNSSIHGFCEKPIHPQFLCETLSCFLVFFLSSLLRQ